MLFNSFAFIAVFLPIVLFGFFAISKYNHFYGALWIAVASLAFYGYWNPAYLPLLLASIAINFAAGRALCAELSFSRRKIVLIAAIGIDLALLGYYKYTNFFVDNLNAVAGLHWQIDQIVLPLGISFFTFTQIAFLVDTYRGEAREAKFIPYVLFVTYFPHLIAGPILHHKEMMPQFSKSSTYHFDSAKLATGLVIFVIGLFKKTCLADNIAPYVGPVFLSAANGAQPTLFDAWSGALGYAFQLYFDFSGYSDMAVGISWMLGIALPLNFNSPYKALNIIEFWRRWHMTLSRFLREYLYIALGGNRRGRFRRHTNLIITMILGGLWHGAGWTFVIWGALQGFYLMVNHAWRATGIGTNSRFGALIGWLVTFVAVTIAWVFFRATSVDAAVRIIAGMVGANGCALPGGIFGCTAVSAQPSLVWQWCAALGFIAFVLPNTQEFVRSLEDREIVSFLRRHSPRWESISWATALGALAALALASLPQPTSFIYFNF
jgi:alginate O-acetyltransferase complex protein AlgI